MLLAVGAGALYVYSQQRQKSEEVPAGPTSIPGFVEIQEPVNNATADGLLTNVMDDEPTCPAGYLLSADKSSCNLVETQQESQEPTCPSGFLISADKTTCNPVQEAAAPDLNVTGKTGSDIGDAAALVAISVGASVAIDGVEGGVKQASAALTAQRQAAAAAEKAKLVEKARDSMKAAKALKAASVAGKATKATGILTKLKGTPWQLIITVIAQVLIAVLDLNAGSFNPCATGEFDLSTLPDWAQALIGALPIVGDLFELFAPVLCFKGGCPPGMENEGGLCYEPCRAGFKSNGATLCYKQYPDFESNGMGHTITSVTKKILMDTGTIPDQAPPGTRQSGALFYNEPGADYDVVAGVAWQRCPSGMTDTGVRCEGLYTNPAGTIPDQP